MHQFLLVLVVAWFCALAGAYFYSRQQHFPNWITVAVLPAFLIEIAFYLVPGFAAVRKAFEHLGSKPVRAAILAGSAVVPYLIESPVTGTFHVSAFVLLFAVVAVASFWYVWFRICLPTDLAFLAVMAAVYMSTLFDQVYGRPAPHLALGILGKLMWIRLGVMAVLTERGMEDVHFGFIPSRQEWRTGIQWYLCFLPIGAILAYLVRFAHFHVQNMAWWKFALLVAGTFLGFLWVVALAEEFFFRAFLQQLLARATHNEMLGLVMASVLFGAAHLPFGSFPNWKFATIGGVTGIFYGLAFLKAHSVRASMVTHALVVTTWRMFFAGS